VRNSDQTSPAGTTSTHVVVNGDTRFDIQIEVHLEGSNPWDY
jgi:hypothetical protein